ncbi:UDP-glucose 4-epimerase GalE [Ancylobacter mangrovi]|uniref:UDP-glucose 4-epimerase GalE n=1 Tax=Ancylobacter mangrovi TaxID=2972472 RepID=UPI002162C683|nr:UDP-glucose 4-epimerase GalE [Ancylobacter mangrovi]MCS0501267.1 UDP-glucose 4-epimerase GalE [Ancylobacter mangrovi]
MAVLVSGGAGYIGSHMVLALIDAGFDVVVLDDLSTGFDWLVHPEATFVRGDVADAALVRRVVREHEVDAVVHFAARIVVPESVADPLGYYLANTAKSRSFLETLIALGVSNFIFSSTAAVYGMVGNDPVSEEAALAPISPYGRSKLMTEWMLFDAAVAHSLRYVALRYFNVAGADPAGRAGQSTRRATHLIKVAAEAALGKRAGIEIFGTDYPTPDGTCLRDYIHVTDLVAAHLDALRYLRAGGASRVLNCGYGWGYSVREVVDTVKRVSGVDFPVRVAQRRAGDPAAIVAGAHCIKRDLGWSPKLADLDLIVAHALSWEMRLGERNRI